MAIKWGYSLNAWTHEENSVRKERNERTFKVLSICGFKGIELQVGSGRWKPLGRPSIIETIYGSTEEFDAYLKSLGIEQIVAWNYDPGNMSFEEDSFGHDPADAGQSDQIVQAAEKYAVFLEKTGGKALAVRPMLSYWREAPVSDDKLITAAHCWNKVGAMTKKYGVKVVLSMDWLCAANSAHGIDVMMENTDPALVDLCIDTAALALKGIDPVGIYEKYSSRVGLFHFEDVMVADELEEHKKPYAEDILKNGGERGLDRWYWEMGSPEGKGLVDFPGLMKSVRGHGYDGWIIVSGRQSADPAASVMFNSWYVQHVLEKN